MKTIAIVGGGSGGLGTANRLAYKFKNEIKAGNIKIILIEGSTKHYYEPGFLEIPFNLLTKENTYREEKNMLAKGIVLVNENAVNIDLKNQIIQTTNQKINYDYIIIATGTSYDYDAVPGLKTGTENFHALETSLKLKATLNKFKKGNIVVGVSSLPYKCMPSPIETVFMLNDFFLKYRQRESVNIQYFYPIPMAFPEKGVSDAIMAKFQDKNIESTLNFQLDSVDNDKHELISKTGDRIKFDLAIVVPPHRGSRVIDDSGIGDKMGWIDTDTYKLNIKSYDNAYAIGDATNLSVSKSGSVADAESIVVSNRIYEELSGSSPHTLYDGSGGAMVLTGLDKAMMIGSSYASKPSLTPESYSFYWLKVIYNNLYWNLTANPVLNGVE